MPRRSSPGRGRSAQPTQEQRLMSIISALPEEEKQKALEKFQKTREGADPDKRFSGGFIRDIFDVIDIPQALAISGMKKAGVLGFEDRGKADPLKYRQSFADLESARRAKEAGEKGHWVGPLLMDIVMDPLNLVGVGLLGKTKHLGKLQKLAGGSDKLMDITKAAQKGDDVADIARAAGVAKSTVSEIIEQVPEMTRAQRLLAETGTVARKGRITPGETLLAGLRKKGGQIGSKIDDAAALDTASDLTKTVKKTKDAIGKRFVYQYGFTKGQIADWDEYAKTKALNTDNVMNIGERVNKLDPAIKKSLLTKNKKGATIRRPLTELQQELSPEDFESVKAAWDEIDRIGQEMVDLKLLDKDVYEANMGEYVGNFYGKYEIGKKGKFPLGSSKRANLDMLKKRKDLPPEVREALEEINDAGYVTQKSLIKMQAAVDDIKFFNDMAKKYGSVDIVEGMSRMPQTGRLGKLSGQYLPGPMAEYMNEIVKTKGPVDEMLGKVVSTFKFGKVVANPATHARNIMSNFMLNSFEGLRPGRVDIYGKAAKELAEKGKYYQEARQFGGLGINTFRANEIGEIIKGKSKAGKLTKKAMDKLGDMYQKEEEFAKMAQFIFQREKGLSAKEAWKVAERATFDYSQVTPFINKMRQSIVGFPFITFSYKATPQVARTAVQTPTKISNLGKVIRGVENQSDEEEYKKEMASMPDYMKDNLFMKLPGKDKYGRSTYLDLTYIIPYGDIVSGEFAKDPIQSNVALQTLRALWKNEDFIGRPIYKESASPTEKGLATADYLRKQLQPAAIDVPGRVAESAKFQQEYAGQSLEGLSEKEQGQFPNTKDVGSELLRSFLGLKGQPLNVEKNEFSQSIEKQKATKQYLEDLGLISTYEIPYLKNSSGGGSRRKRRR